MPTHTPKANILHTEWASGWGGQEIRILAESQAFIARGYHMIIACQPDSPLMQRANEAGVPTIPLVLKKGLSFGAVFDTKKIIKEQCIDLVHTHSSVDAWRCGIAARLTGVPVVRSRHLSTPIKAIATSRYVYMKLADKVITSGQSIKDRMVDINGMNAEKIVSVPAGIDEKRFHPGVDGSKVRQEFGFTADDFVVGIVAVLRIWKGHTYLVQAVKQLLDDGRRVKLLMCGAGPQQENLEKLIEELGVGDDMVMAGHRKDVERCIAAMDCVVLPSTKNEATSQVLPQAMAMKKPVIAADAGSLAEVVIDKQTGRLVPIEDVSALKEALTWMIDKPDERQQVAEQGYQHCMDHFTFTQMIDSTEAVYRELLGLEGVGS